VNARLETGLKTNALQNAAYRPAKRALSGGKRRLIGTQKGMYQEK